MIPVDSITVQMSAMETLAIIERYYKKYNTQIDEDEKFLLIEDTILDIRKGVGLNLALKYQSALQTYNSIIAEASLLNFSSLAKPYLKMMDCHKQRLVTLSVLVEKAKRQHRLATIRNAVKGMSKIARTCMCITNKGTRCVHLVKTGKNKCVFHLSIDNRTKRQKLVKANNEKNRMVAAAAG